MVLKMILIKMTLCFYYSSILLRQKSLNGKNLLKIRQQLKRRKEQELFYMKKMKIKYLFLRLN
nr:MAG TPA: hypothetical protein [Caudoviricetes sp.]